MAKDVVGNTARKSVSPKLQVVDARRGTDRVQLTGPWKLVRNSTAVGRTLARTTATGAAAKVTFKGRQVAVVVRRGPSGGRLKVILDGKHIDTIDLYASKVDQRRIAYVRNVGIGRHVLKLRPAGSADPKSTGRTIWLDAVLVLDRRT